MEFLMSIVALVLVITIHEFSHAWVANFLGDPTAKNEGRVSLNPLRHLDPLGTLMIFIIRIGWGKPVPVNPYNFKKPHRDEALTALAGPMANLVLAVVCAIPLKYFGHLMMVEIHTFLVILLQVSVLLFAFNMLPFPPLDGSKFVQWFVPRAWQPAYSRYLRNGNVYFVIFLILDSFILSRYLGVSILGEFVGFISTIVISLVFLGS